MILCLELCSAKASQASDSLPNSERRVLRALPLNSTTAFSDYRAWLNFTALKFIFISCSFFPMDSYLLSSIFIWAWITVCHCLMVFLLSHSLLSAVCSFQGLSFCWTWTATGFAYPCLTLGPLEIFVLPEFLALVNLPLSPFFLFFCIWHFSQIMFISVHSGLLSQPSM